VTDFLLASSTPLLASLQISVDLRCKAPQNLERTHENLARVHLRVAPLEYRFVVQETPHRYVFVTAAARTTPLVRTNKAASAYELQAVLCRQFHSYAMDKCMVVLGASTELFVC
jgi:hypothetical protein